MSSEVDNTPEMLGLAVELYSRSIAEFVVRKHDAMKTGWWGRATPAQRFELERSNPWIHLHRGLKASNGAGRVKAMGTGIAAGGLGAALAADDRSTALAIFAVGGAVAAGGALTQRREAVVARKTLALMVKRRSELYLDRLGDLDGVYDRVRDDVTNLSGRFLRAFYDNEVLRDTVVAGPKGPKLAAMSPVELAGEVIVTAAGLVSSRESAASMGLGH